MRELAVTMDDVERVEMPAQGLELQASRAAGTPGATLPWRRSRAARLG